MPLRVLDQAHNDAQKVGGAFAFSRGARAQMLSSQFLQLRDHIAAQQFERTHGICVWHRSRLGFEQQ